VFEEKRPFGRWADNIKLDIRRKGWKMGIRFIWLRMGTVAAAVNTIIQSNCYRMRGIS
jgi:hypothetical protein